MKYFNCSALIKKSIVFTIFLLNFKLIFGTLIVNTGNLFVFNSTDSVFIFNSKLNIIPEIEYVNSNVSLNDVEWRKFDNTVVASQQKLLYKPETDTGYVLFVNGNKVSSFWVIDYDAYLPQPIALTLDETYEELCNFSKLDLDGQIPELKYNTLIKTNIPIDRCEITHDNIKWESESWSSPQEETPEFQVSGNSFIVPAPLCETFYTLTLDKEIRTMLAMEPLEVKSGLYQPAAVSSHPTTIVQIRTALNEKDRPSDAKQQEGSAPLDMLFKSFPTPGVKYYNWTIYKDGVLIVTRHEEEHRYNFNQEGKYKVYLNVSNDFQCSHKDSIEITVNESLLEVPSVFTPNGDGKNDEFRVKYRSLVRYQCWVKNRWGRTVYYSEDPQKGWDGRINGNDAASGAYFYIIKAIGAKGEKFDRKGPINIVR